MTDVAIMTLALVVVTAIYVAIIRKQVRQSANQFRAMAIRSEIAILTQKRYQVESDETQLRIRKQSLQVIDKRQQSFLNIGIDNVKKR